MERAQFDTQESGELITHNVHANSETTQEGNVTPREVEGRLLGILSRGSGLFSDAIYFGVYKFDGSCAGRENAVIADCVEAASPANLKEIMSLLDNVEDAATEATPRGDIGHRIADILFKNPEVDREELETSPRSIMARMSPQLARSGSAFASAFYTRVYLFDRSCAGREDDVIQECIERATPEELRSVAYQLNLLYEQMESPERSVNDIRDIASAIADVLFKKMH